MSTKENIEELRFYVVIPAHNEEGFIGLTLDSLLNQQLIPQKIIVVDDHSEDNTAAVVETYCQKHDFIKLIKNTSSTKHLPGSKVVQAFNKGLDKLDDNFDVICKFDADLILPPDYFKILNRAFMASPKLGMAGGFCYIQKNGEWVLENLTDKTHIRGALKAYRKKCFQDIGGLKTAMGWDTVDELLAQYHGWKVQTFPELKVKHLRITGASYRRENKYIFGEALYSLRYGFFITFIASAKMAWLKKDFSSFNDYMKGYFLGKKNKVPFLVSKQEGKWIRKYRWKKMMQKIF